MTGGPGQHSLNYRPDIDGLRAVAVILVVLFHAFPDFCRGGFVGVDMFFVISGYLITGNILAGIGANKFSYLDFYARRFRRIVPALVIVLATVLVLGWFLLLPQEFLDLSRHTIAGSTFTSNILLLMQTGYFDTASDLKPLLHLWSLGVEEQYYIVWPAMLVFAYRTRLNKLAAIAILGAASFAFMLAAPEAGAFFLLPARFWELLLGGALAWCALERGPALARLRDSFSHPGLTSQALGATASALAVALLAVAVTALDKSTPYPGWNALLPTLAAALIIASGPGAWLNRTILANRAAVTLGLMSYPLYLWHWPLLSFARIVAGETPPGWVRVVLVAVSLPLAWATWRLIEIPVRQKLLGAIQPGRRRKAALYAAAASLAVLLAASDTAVRFRILPSHMPASEDVGQEKWQIQLTRMFGDGYSADGICTGDDNCAATAPHPTIVVYGDSHAEHFFPGLASALPGEGWLLLSRSACPPVANLDVQQGNYSRDCLAWNKRAVTYLIGDNGIGTVVLASLAMPYFDGLAHSAYSRDGAFKISSNVYAGSLPDIFYLGLVQTIRSLSDAGKQVVLVVDNPEFPFDIGMCARSGLLRSLFAGMKNCVLPRRAFDDRVALYSAMIGRVKSEFPQLAIYDPTSLICDRSACSPWHDNRLLYRDRDHLSLYGSEFVGRDFGKWLAQQETAKQHAANSGLQFSGGLKERRIEPQ
jgi:peptidoglycan/LPS O-acetylase OafA/YrhL